ncbi:basic phospholipase A2 homolog 2-like [Octopus sinensis]|uniref:Basic phospholipase A2 homolog 2-like n=1 Tax=Octopus sinensis TaxID=2607531 RepID=A0A7E6EP23_9MOLL|nr:basic phospholipase A2 homolog 2-like [Octopus sinensis]
MVLFRYLIYFSFCFFVAGSRQNHALHRIKKDEKKSRHPRDLTSEPQGHPPTDIISDLGTMIKILTGKDDIEFNVYGLYCVRGYGGFGIPVDSIDRCCQQYNYCYAKVRKNDCLLSRMERLKYDWHYDGKDIICVNTQKCLKSRCSCDKLKATCLRNHMEEYNPSFLGRFLDQIIG